MYAILIRTVFFYVLLTLLIRLMGKRQIGELQLTEFVAAMLLSELAALPMTDRDIPVSHGVTALATTVCLEVVISFVSRRCPRQRFTSASGRSFSASRSAPPRGKRQNRY